MRYMVTLGTPEQLAKNRMKARLRREQETETGGLQQDKSRLNHKDRQWRRKVVAKASGRCEECGTEIRLHAHHTIPVSQSPGLRYEIKNGECLCYKCHADRHPEIKNFMLSAVVVSSKDMAKIMSSRLNKIKSVAQCINPDDCFIEYD